MILFLERKSIKKNFNIAPQALQVQDFRTVTGKDPAQ